MDSPGLGYITKDLKICIFSAAGTTNVHYRSSFGESSFTAKNLTIPVSKFNFGIVGKRHWVVGETKGELMLLISLAIYRKTKIPLFMLVNKKLTYS